MARTPSPDSDHLARAARQLMETYGSRAAEIAVKRAAYLHQSGEAGSAAHWREIAALVREIEAAEAGAPAKETTSH
jgi:hypothetical protein